MPNVTVTYQNGQFTFAPNSVAMTAAGTITFTRTPGSDWEFTGFSCPDDPGDFSVVNSLPAPTMTVRDAHRNLGTFDYSVSISNGEESDPQVINKT